MRPRPVLRTALLLVAAASAPAVAAPRDPGCDRYALRGLLPGMTSRDVVREMGGKGDEVRVEGGDGRSASSVTYHGSPSPVTVLYDGIVGRGEARVREVRMDLPEQIDRAPREVLAVLDRLGPPAFGKENLGAGLDDGPTAWADRACNVLVLARREEENWWEASRRTNALVVHSLDTACRAAGLPGLPWDAICAKPATASGPPVGVLVGAAVLEPVPAAVEEPPSPAVSEPAPAAVEESPSPVSPAETTDPVRATYIAPRYPEALRRNRVPGRVSLQLTVEADGRVSEVRVLSAEPKDMGFERAAIEAARRWRYRPGTRDGVPVRDTVTVRVGFE